MDRAEAGLRAQTGEKPSGGYYTSSERITLQKFSLGRITRLPRSVFGSRIVSGGGGGNESGGAGGGGTVSAGSAIVVRPQTTLVDRAQTLQIQTNAQSIGGLQQSLDIIRTQVTELNEGIQNTAKQLQAESALEQSQLKQEQEAERKLAERKVRLGKESELEKNIQAALSKPITKLQQTVTGLFDRVFNALRTLFFGWLTNQGIETLKALSEGNSEKLEEIKNNVIKNILFAIGAFAAVKIGFGLLLRSIAGLTLRLAGFVARIALSPFKMAGAAIARLFKFGKGAKPPVKPSGRVPITASGGRALSRSGPVARFLGGVRNIGKYGKSFFRGAGSFASKIFAPISIGIGSYRFAKGDPIGGLLSFGSAIPGFGLGFAALDVAREFGLGKGTFFGKKENQSIPQLTPTPETPELTPTPTPTAETPELTPTPTPTAEKPELTPTPTPTPETSAQPKTSAMPSISELTFGVDIVNMLQGSDESLSKEKAPPYDLINVEDLIQEKPPAADIQAPPKSVTPVGSLPEAKPNIIMAGGGRDRTQTMVSEQESLTDVPFIPSSNTDNFYVLYSQINYNVIV